MAKKLTESAIMNTLNFGYDYSMNGIPLLKFLTAEELAQSYMRESGALRDKADSLIRWQNTKAGTAGFLSGLGGILIMPITIPTNLAAI